MRVEVHADPEAGDCVLVFVVVVIIIAKRERHGKPARRRFLRPRLVRIVQMCFPTMGQRVTGRGEGNRRVIAERRRRGGDSQFGVSHRHDAPQADGCFARPLRRRARSRGLQERGYGC